MSILANKYRPKKLADLIGQPSVVTTLTNAINKNRLHHAYLFHGGMGTGKTSTAYILAAMLNCEKGPIAEPCGECRICTAIFSNKLEDVIEIDAASNGKIDEVRQIRNSAHYAPTSQAKYKIFIIDECLPYDAKVTVSGSETSIGELVESHQVVKDAQGESNHGYIPQFVRGLDFVTGKTVARKIIRYIKIPNDKQMYEIFIQDSNDKIRILKITGNHSVFIENGEKVKAETLKVGQKVFREESPNNPCEILSVAKIDWNDPFVYNLEVEAQDDKDKNYFADGVCVSNCHSLTSQGEEALLKLIEQPPSRVKFILCTTDLQKMRPTIVSRCQSYTFKKVYWKTIFDHLSEIAKKEKADISDESLIICSKMAKGSVRNGIQHLDKLISYAAGRTATKEIANEVFETIDDDVYYKVFDCIISTDGKPKATDGYKVINQIVSSGVDVRVVLDGLSEHLRELLIASTCKDTSGLLQVTEEGKKRLSEQKARFSVPLIIKLQKLLSESYRISSFGILDEHVLDQWFIQSVLIAHNKA